ncbi:hypothetical protein PsYK624_150760 [Phanerochaete sordida]|uniref:Uncharacterized protein n=1 Tax=Phanerochaete sordida TaxID=48140 RepID=A0A9P3GSV2_9APHY|nr:hypothetical protein PsYK624_150760 [Phanerochaete sordida]
MQRPLTLHASALTDPEYTLYTTALLDLAGEDAASHPHDDSYYAALVVSARETRAWVRGRYTELAPARVDAVLKLFTPNIAPADTLSGGQFFAALRLVTHIRHGRPLDGSLVFVQGESPFRCRLWLGVSVNPFPAPGDRCDCAREEEDVAGPAARSLRAQGVPILRASPVLLSLSASTRRRRLQRTMSQRTLSACRHSPSRHRHDLLLAALILSVSGALPRPPAAPTLEHCGTCDNADDVRTWLLRLRCSSK